MYEKRNEYAKEFIPALFISLLLYFICIIILIIFTSLFIICALNNDGWQFNLCCPCCIPVLRNELRVFGSPSFYALCV